MTSCGPRSGISNDNNEPAVCGVKDQTLADTNKIIPQTVAQANGKKLFMLHCRQCHMPLDNQSRDGNTLQGLFDRLPKTENYFSNFILNSDSVKKSGDPYANKIDHDYNVDYEHKFKNVLSIKEIADIADYIKLRPTD